jgi:hypothetical protein
LGPLLGLRGTPSHLATAADGSVLALAWTAGFTHGTLLHISRRGAGWVVREVPLPSVPVLPPDGLLPSDGHTAALAHGEDAGCRLVAVDLVRGEALAAPALACGPGEAVRSLAVEQTVHGPTAFVGLWRWPEGAAAHPTGAGRVAAIDLRSGAARQVMPLAGSPERLVAARAGERLYALEVLPGPQDARRGGEYEPPQAWRLAALHTATLALEDLIALRQPAVRLAVAPDGAHAYALNWHDGPPTSTSVAEIDLAAGAIRHLATLPGLSLDLAVAAERLYAAHSDGDEVWAIDRRSGRVVATLPAGRHPVALALGSR